MLCTVMFDGLVEIPFGLGEILQFLTSNNLSYQEIGSHGLVRFLLGNSPASEFYMLTFRNNLFHLHRQ